MDRLEKSFGTRLIFRCVECTIQPEFFFRKGDGRALLLFLDMPAFIRPSLIACSFGRYFKREIAVRTIVLVSRETFATLLTTRDTVAVETPANLATSSIIGWGSPFVMSEFFIINL